MPKGGKREGSGRKLGVPNKLTGDIKAMILGALEQVGGQDYLAVQAKANPGPFMALLGKVLPTQITGAGGGPLSMIIETGVPREPDTGETSQSD